MAGRVPPHDLDAEAAVLSAVLLEKDAIDKVVTILRPDQFYAEANRWVYEGAVELTTKGTPVDIVSVAGWLRDRDRLNQIGGSAYLAQLSDAVPAVSHLDTYAKMVAEKWAVRQTIATCQRIAAEGYGDYGEAKQYIDAAEQAIYDIARPGSTSELEQIGGPTRRAIEQVTEAARRGERITGMSTGFERLDGKTAGLHDGELTIIAARPGMGKTSFVMNVAVNVAKPIAVEPERDRYERADDQPEAAEKPGAGVAIFSCEMPREQLAQRMLCCEARVELGKFRQGFLHDRDWSNLYAGAQAIHGLPIHIDDASSPTVLEIRAKARRLAAELGRRGVKLGLIIVDYLQLMSGSGNTHSREQEIAEISRGLKGLAKELKMPVIALSQLNRAVETRGKDKRPQLSDLRESGAIEQDADNIIFIYRDDYYDGDSSAKGVAELIIAKQRNGPTGKVKVRFDSAFTRFDNLAPGDAPDWED